jgi:hypothetical protein
MTDGADSTSRLGNAGFWRLLQEKRIRLYAIGLGFDLHAYQPTFASTGERILTHAALATNGRLFFARTAEELHGFYQRVADELRTVSSYDVRPTLSRGTGSLTVVATGERIPKLATPQLELMLDASGSTKEKLKGKGPRKIDIAKEAMAQIIEGLPDGLPVALRVFGHRIRERQPGDCQDSELIVPFAPLDKPHLLNQVRAIQALGTTPIAYSLQQVEHDFGGAQGEKIVILITDGREEGKGNPSAVVSEMLAKAMRRPSGSCSSSLNAPEAASPIPRMPRPCMGRLSKRWRYPMTCWTRRAAAWPAASPARGRSRYQKASTP